MIWAVLCVSAFAAPKRPPLPERYAKWLNNEVVYIITDQERKAFLEIGDDVTRDKFIEDFWEIRNPGRGPDNPYKTEHYERINYANAHFGKNSNTPGWMTDQGRTWILFGKPTSQHPFVGYGQIYPLELWFYDNPTRSPSLPNFFYVLFYMPGDIGELKFYRPFIDGPMKLVRGSQFNSNADVYKFLQPLGGDVAHASMSLIAGDPIDTQSYRPDMSSDMLISKIQNFANDHFNLEQIQARRSLRGMVTSRLLTAGKDLSISTITLTDAVHEKWLDFCVPIDEELMGVRTPDGEFALDFYYNLSTDGGTLILEDEVKRKYPAYARAGAFSPFEIAGRIPVVPGKYKLDVSVINHTTGRSFRDQTTFTVPGTAKDTWLSGPLLADSVSTVERSGATIPYQYFGAQFHPLFHGELRATSKLQILYQVYQPSPADCDAEYVLANVISREDRTIVKEHIAAAEFKNGLLLKSKSLDTSALPPGEYLVAVQIKSPTGAAMASINQRLHIVNAAPSDDLRFIAEPQTLEAPGIVDYMRGLSAMGQHDDAAAQRYLERCIRKNPANRFARQFLVRAYYHQRNYQAISDINRQGTLKDFDSSPDLMAEIAVSLWNTGDQVEGKQVLAKALGLFPQDSSLAAVNKMFSDRRN